MKYNLGLFARITIVGIIATFIHSLILTEIASNYALLGVFLMFIILPLAIGIGLILFIYIQKNSLAKYINKKNVNIFCIILAATIILPAIIEYYVTVPPEEIRVNPGHLRDYWNCDKGQELCTKVDKMELIYDFTGGGTYGNLMGMNGTIASISWHYDRLSKELILDGTIRLKVEITGDKDNLKMTTYYVSGNRKIEFHSDTQRFSLDAKQFNGVTWTKHS